MKYFSQYTDNLHGNGVQNIGSEVNFIKQKTLLKGKSTVFIFFLRNLK